RFRFDQLMNLGWKTLIPLAMLNVVITGAGLLFNFTYAPWAIVIVMILMVVVSSARAPKPAMRVQRT
ncbi:MAG: NADH-quinone oxidoreductase subunit H, partial [Rudanella sp.]|nr:NADH-quinone oxidoreductase subunit H [Rudanella sp.]